VRRSWRMRLRERKGDNVGAGKGMKKKKGACAGII
jgi:hypothetical protein